MEALGAIFRLRLLASTRGKASGGEAWLTEEGDIEAMLKNGSNER